MELWDNQYPDSSEYAHYYGIYVQEVPRQNVIETLNTQMHEIYTLINSIPGDKAYYCYQEGKWTTKEVFGHLIDTERMFAMRAHAFSRGETASIFGFEQDEYILNSNYNERSLANIGNEYLAVRISTIHLFNNMTKDMIAKKGTASGFGFTVRSIPFIIAGHERYHIDFLKEKYLK